MFVSLSVPIGGKPYVTIDIVWPVMRTVWPV